VEQSLINTSRNPRNPKNTGLFSARTSTNQAKIEARKQKIKRNQPDRERN